MDASKLIQMRMQAANVYKSNWQGRDASEVTLRKQAMASQNAQRSQFVNSGAIRSVHQGPAAQCCTDKTPRVPRSTSPTAGFSTDYTQDLNLGLKKAGCANCNDPVFGAPGGVNLKSCAEVTIILAVPENPVKGTKCCSDPGVPFHATADCTKVAPAYSGWRNHVPVSNTGTIPIQVPLYPSH